MRETVEQYKTRIAGYRSGQDPLQMQREMPKTLQTTISTIPQELLHLRPSPGKWSISEIVTHLADDELVGAYRIRLILGAPGTEIQAFDQQRWSETGKYSLRNVKESLQLFTVLRQANLALFALLDQEQWKLYGIHAERGRESIRDIAEYYAGHDINHLLQIREIARNLQKTHA